MGSNRNTLRILPCPNGSVDQHHRGALLVQAYCHWLMTGEILTSEETQGVHLDGVS